MEVDLPDALRSPPGSLPVPPPLVRRFYVQIHCYEVHGALSPLSSSTLGQAHVVPARRPVKRASHLRGVGVAEDDCR